MFVAAGLLWANNLAAQPLKDSRPNIVFIFADDLGYNDVACYGNPYFQTPNIDKLASTGYRFTQAYVAAPNCAPSRACLMTGMFTPKHGIYTVENADRGKSENRKLIPVKNIQTLDTSFYTIAEMLRDAGYDCASIGKWHLGGEGYSPTDQGFALNIGGNQRGATPSHFDKYRRVLPGLGDEGDSVFLADAMTDKAIGFIEQQRSRPYFLYLPFYSVHSPVQAPEQLVKKYKKLIPANSPYNPVYAAMVENLDWNVGRLVEAVQQSGGAANTLIIFSSDNGPVLNHTTVEFRGEKGSLYEGGIREPFIMNWPGTITPAVSDAIISSVDIFPTFAELAGAAINKLPAGLDGRSFLPVFSKGSLTSEPLIWHFPAYLETYNKARGTWRETPASAVRYGDWKLVLHYETGQYELFHLPTDSKEQHNLISRETAMAEELKKILNRYLSGTKAFIPSEPNPGYTPIK